VQSAAALQKIENAPEPSDSTARLTRRAIIRVMETWRLAHRDTTRTARSLQQLRALLPLVPKLDVKNAKVEIALIEAMRADITGGPVLRDAVSRLDSLQTTLDYSAIAGSRQAQAAIATAHFWERLGEPRKALLAASRYSVWWNQSTPYLADQIREEARLAAKVGERKRALRSYTTYLGLMATADGALRPQIDSVRTELAALNRRQ
jgi:hypothetical protein